MKLGDGVEQSIHAVALLSGLQGGAVLPAASIGEFLGSSVSYLLKHLQAMSREGILESVPGPKGGYRLGRTAEKISLLDIVLSVEGPRPAFRCSEIRQRGPNQLPKGLYLQPCTISVAMLRAERVYRAELAKTTVAEITTQWLAQGEGVIAERSCTFLEINKRSQT